MSQLNFYFGAWFFGDKLSRVANNIGIAADWLSILVDELRIMKNNRFAAMMRFIPTLYTSLLYYTFSQGRIAPGTDSAE